MTRTLTFATLAGVLAFAGVIGAQQFEAQTPPRPSTDPRVGLKAGLEDAGVAVKNLELVAHIQKPDNFQDPAGGFSFMNSDFAFQGPHVFQGNFNGFNFYNVEDPRKPQLRTSFVCPGGQGDLSVYKNLLFMSVEETRGRVDCGSQGVQAVSSPDRFRGVRIFDITDIARPKQIATVQTCRGSHTHTLVVMPNDKDHVYIYGSGTAGVRQAKELDGCVGDPNDPNTSLFSIDVIQVPLKAPETARVVNRPRIFADSATGAPNGLWKKTGDHGPETQTTNITNQCHDITTYPALGLAAGACSGNGILLDISDPIHPKRLDAVTDNAFAYWHSATFNNDGTKVLFSDEWGGGTAPRCRNTDLLTWGADAIFDIVNKKLVFGSYYKMPAPQTDTENCVAHNGSMVPVPGRDIMVQAWYQGGLSMFDFTDSKHPVEIAYFDRGPVYPDKLAIGGYWSAYYYNGYIYGSEIMRGLDIFKLVASDQLSQNEIDAAASVKWDELNVQEQAPIRWPASFAVARAYVDQLERGQAVAAEKIASLHEALDRAEKAAGPARTTALGQLKPLAAQLAADAPKATGADAKRMKALAETLQNLK
ncbi:MAG TPA: hypothetical protein VFV78_14125 [Vicinamibacterales bacterium]|nr:hypothetical protein [Vicinamibacterales bacterium]